MQHRFAKTEGSLPIFRTASARYWKPGKIRKRLLDSFSQILVNPPAVITLDEVGCGIVPMEKSERDYREAVGHAGQMLAAAAAEVYRMQCGIAVRIK